MNIDANKILSDCNREWTFWIHSGTIVRNIYEMVKAIETMSDEVFTYHVNDDNQKNDFALWIEAVLGDDMLASKLKYVRDRKRYAAIIRERIKYLEKNSDRKVLEVENIN